MHKGQIWHFFNNQLSFISHWVVQKINVYWVVEKNNVFYHFSTWVASAFWSRDLKYSKQIFRGFSFIIYGHGGHLAQMTRTNRSIFPSPILLRLYNEFWFRLTQRFLRCLKSVDKGGTDDGACPYLKLIHELKGNFKKQVCGSWTYWFTLSKQESFMCLRKKTFLYLINCSFLWCIYTMLHLD